MNSYVERLNSLDNSEGAEAQELVSNIAEAYLKEYKDNTALEGRIYGESVSQEVIIGLDEKQNPVSGFATYDARTEKVSFHTKNGSPIAENDIVSNLKNDWVATLSCAESLDKKEPQRNLIGSVQQLAKESYAVINLNLNNGRTISFKPDIELTDAGIDSIQKKMGNAQVSSFSISDPKEREGNKFDSIIEMVKGTKTEKFMNNILEHPKLSLLALGSFRLAKSTVKGLGTLAGKFAITMLADGKAEAQRFQL